MIEFTFKSPANSFLAEGGDTIDIPPSVFTTGYIPLSPKIGNVDDNGCSNYKYLNELIITFNYRRGTNSNNNNYNSEDETSQTINNYHLQIMNVNHKEIYLTPTKQPPNNNEPPMKRCYNPPKSFYITYEFTPFESSDVTAGDFMFGGNFMLGVTFFFVLIGGVSQCYIG